METGTLTSRQRQVLQLKADGLANKQTCYALGISLASLDEHIVGIKKKLGALSTTHAVAIAVRARVIN